MCTDDTDSLKSLCLGVSTSIYVAVSLSQSECTHPLCSQSPDLKISQFILKKTKVKNFKKQLVEDGVDNIRGNTLSWRYKSTLPRPLEIKFFLFPLGFHIVTLTKQKRVGIFNYRFPLITDSLAMFTKQLVALRVELGCLKSCFNLLCNCNLIAGVNCLVGLPPSVPAFPRVHNFELKG